MDLNTHTSRDSQRNTDNLTHTNTSTKVVSTTFMYVYKYLVSPYYVGTTPARQPFANKIRMQMQNKKMELQIIRFY